jgi:hypothetical protein
MRFPVQALAVMAALLAVTTDTIANVSVVFSPKEVAIIRDYYTHAQQDAGRGKAGKQKQQGLPPGVAKNLERGKALPPGIAKQQLPGDLSRRLPPVRDGYERILVDGRVLLVEIATQIIHDVLMDAVFR